MKTLKHWSVFFIGLLFVACQKEFSQESGFTGEPATGSLQNLAGDCQPITVSGTYVVDSVLTDSNFVVVQVQIATPGKYRIFSDTSNGFYFTDSGYTAISGLQSFKLKGHGTPLSAQETNFIVAFDTTFCRFTVPVLNAPPIDIPPTSNDYFPTGERSNWTYEVSLSGDTNRITVKVGDSTILGNTYSVFVHASSAFLPDTNYYRKSNGSYYQYSSLDDFGSYDTVYNKVEYTFLKDNVPVNTSWTTPEVDVVYNNVPGKTKLFLTIVGKDIQTTIGSTTIDSVIKVKRDYIFTPNQTGTPLTLGTVYYYYAKNIGLIKVESTDPFPVVINIRRWEIYY